MGEKYQQKLLDLLEYDSYEMAKGNFKPYDLKVIHKSDTTTYEVKADRMTHRTGNIVIEFECSNKPSGITTTEADFWVYFVDGTNTYYIIPTEHIRTLIKEEKYSRKVKGGDGWRANLFLFPTATFSDFCESY